MSQPNEPSFEDDFDCDTDPPEQYDWQPYTIEDIAIEKAHDYASKETEGVFPPTHERHFYSELKEAYQAGFLEGFAHRFTTNDKVSE
jgi:hypothetical protein